VVVVVRKGRRCCLLVLVVVFVVAVQLFCLLGRRLAWLGGGRRIHTGYRGKVLLQRRLVSVAQVTRKYADEAIDAVHFA